LGYAHHQYKGIRTIHNKTKSNNALGDNTMGPRHNLWNSDSDCRSYQLRLKELKHRKLGWKGLILKYELGKSLGKEMWCKMADTKHFLDTFVKMKNACNMR